MTPALEAPTVELVLFDVDACLFAADVTLVEAISREPAHTHPSLGAPGPRRRALVVRTDGRVAQLGVDQVLGVRAAPSSALRRMPLAAAAHPLASGVWLDERAPIILIDLTRLPAGD